MATAASPQTWIAGRGASHASVVAEPGSAVLAVLAPRPGERILDLACGDGALTEKLLAPPALCDSRGDRTADHVRLRISAGLPVITPPP